MPGAAQATPAIQVELPGDVNGDGALTIEDARLVRDVLGEEVDAPADFELRAEVSGNGAITLVDAELIESRALGALDRWPVKYGDLNGDLAVDLSDGFVALRLALGGTPPSFTIGLLADVDGDDEIGLVDSSLILAHALGLLDFFPVDPPPPIDRPTPTSTAVGDVPSASATPSAFAIAGTATPTPITGGQPDLVILSMKIDLQSGPGCYNPPAALGARVDVGNLGAGEAGHFAVWVEGVLQPVEGLAAGEAASLWFSGYDQNDMTAAIVDYSDEVPESDEGNNTREERLPVPTPPVTCTPTPVRTSTPPPIPTFTRTPTPPAGGLPDLVITTMEMVYLGNYGCFGGELATYLEIANVGGSDAGGFSLWFMDVLRRFDDGLAAGESRSVWYPYYYFPNVVSTATIDYWDEVPEGDESNNSRAEVLHIPDPPTCTPTPILPGSASATPSPKPPGGGTITATRTPTSTPPAGASATPTRTPTSNPPGGATVSATPYRSRTPTPIRTATPTPFPPAGGTATATPYP